MGVSVFYDILLPRESIARALRFLAERAPRPDRGLTTVALPNGEQLVLPFSTEWDEAQRFVDCAGEKDLYLWLDLKVDIDDEVAQQLRVFEPHTYVTEIDGKFYRYKDDLSEDDFNDMACFDEEQLRDHGVLVSTGTTEVGVNLFVSFTAELDPNYAQLHISSWTRTTHSLFYSSPSFEQLFTDLVAAVEAVCWVQGTDLDNDLIVNSLHGKPVPGLEIPGEKAVTLDELAAAVAGAQSDAS
ncbi:hypothetical protein [Nocardia anaemiae]|uniref:hypothetical protein n=1 Tax=Nocardia anaemiae TaxID=263910 RepID=UPI0007A46435|nr:hypothetical protein [Nocardia anaemiae]